MKIKVRQKHKNRARCWCRCRCGNQIAKQRERAGYVICQPCNMAWRGQEEGDFTHGIRYRDHGGARVATPSRSHSKAAARRIWIHLAIYHAEDNPQVATMTYAQLDELHRTHHEKGAPSHTSLIPFARSLPRRERFVREFP